MKIVITGAEGMLGRALVARLGHEHVVVAAPRAVLDVTRAAHVRQWLDLERPQAVVHAAALTDVDGCESRVDDAFRVNALGTQNVARECARLDALLVHVSTDYVFDGTSRLPYSEWDVPNPLSVYGRSKHAAEVLVRETGGRAIIVRTSALFGPHGRHFVGAILDAARAGRPLRVVSDQRTLPTYAPDLADAIARLVFTDVLGTYHVTNTAPEGIGFDDWARAALAIAGVDAPVTSIPSTELTRPARRPANAVLGGYAFAGRGFTPLRPCLEALEAYLTA